VPVADPAELGSPCSMAGQRVRCHQLLLDRDFLSKVRVCNQAGMLALCLGPPLRTICRSAKISLQPRSKLIPFFRNAPPWSRRQTQIIEGSLAEFLEQFKAFLQFWGPRNCPRVMSTIYLK
jgi:hypothetical protein